MHYCRPSVLIRTAAAVAAVGGLLVSIPACSDDDESGGKDPSSTCAEMCTGAEFGSSRVDAHPHEINCFCTGGTGTVSATACTNMCSALGKTKSEPFGNGPQGPDACQCS
jgi:hypothetical protein